MYEDSAGDLPASPLTAALRYWYVVLPLTVLGLVVGLLLAASRPTLVTAEARLAVGSADLASYQVAGFGPAATQLASNYARYIGAQRSREQQRELVGDLVDQVDSVEASPIPESNIVRVEVVASSEDVALQAADRTAKRLVGLTTIEEPGRDPAQVLKQFTGLSGEVAQAQAAQDEATRQLDLVVADKASPAAIAAARAVVASARAKTAVLQLRQDAVGGLFQELSSEPPSQSRLVPVNEAFISGTDASSKYLLFGAGGAVLGGLLGLLIAMTLGRRRRESGSERVEPELDDPRPNQVSASTRQSVRPTR